MPGATYRFGRFTLDAARGLLLGPDGAIALRPKSFALLQLLARNPDRLLSHDEIASMVWPETTATDESIVQCVRDIRRALGAGADALIRTLPRRGYMLVSAVPPGANADRPMLEVQPPAPVPDTAAGRALAESLTEEVVTELICRRAVLIAAGPDGQTRYRLYGRMRTEGGRVLIHIRLVDRHITAHIWSTRFDRDRDELAASQPSLAREIARAAEQAIAAAERRYALHGTVEAFGPWRLYQRGLWHSWRCTPADNAEARRLFQRAIEADPAFAAGHAALAMTYFYDGVVYDFTPGGDSLARAVAMANTAVRLDPGDATVQATQGMVTFVTGDIGDAWDQASLAVAQAEDLAWARSVRGIVKLYAGYPSEGRSLLLQAQRIAPQDVHEGITVSQTVISYYYDRAYKEAVMAAQAGIARYPAYPLTHRWLAAALAQLGQRQEARDALRQAQAVSHQSFLGYVRKRPSWFRLENHEHMLDGLRKAGWRAP
jgi:DNA-binding winged helix-turn-helix (wHTH) protein/tetratricopeptide (TPR) repeat protein